MIIDTQETLSFFYANQQESSYQDQEVPSKKPGSKAGIHQDTPENDRLRCTPGLSNCEHPLCLWVQGNGTQAQSTRISGK